MTVEYTSGNTELYTFTVKRIAKLQTLLACADKKTVNKFITDVRYSVSTFHTHQLEAEHNKKIKAHERFFARLNDKAHQLARFTTDLSVLVNEAPTELFDEAKKADNAIDKIHGHLVNLCLSIDSLSQQKTNFYHDANMTMNDIYAAYCKVFKTKPSGRTFFDGEEIPADTPLEDLLVPIVEILLLKDRKRCNKLVQGVI